MKKPLSFAAPLVLALATAVPSGASAQATGGTASPKPLSTSLGIVVFPAKGQSATKQAADEGECFAWSKGQTGVDPLAPAPAPQASTAAPAAAPAADGSRARGAVRGAAAGALIGEVADNDAGKGAAIGATAGVLKGGADSRRGRQRAEQQAQAEAVQQAEAEKAAAAEQRALFDKGFAACLEARGYTVK